MEQMDFSTPWGKLALSMLGGLAEFYSDNLSQETKKGWSERKAQGLYCGLLPFGAMKGEDGVPVPHPDTFAGLQMAFDLIAQGNSDRDVAKALNEKEYRTAGNQGNRPFTKDTVRDMLQNRFYLGELPDGNGGWLEGKHKPLISQELFDAAQEQRGRRQRSKNGSVTNKAKTYSLSGMVFCQICKSKAGIHRGHGSKPRLYCRGRAQGADCNCKGAFLEVYEAQIQWYLESFAIPKDYQEKILEAHRKLDRAYDDADRRRTQLQNRLGRIKDLYKWEHIDRDEYLREYDEIQRQLCALTPSEDDGDVLSKLADFLANVSDAWKEASQEQRNKLASTLFEEVWVEHNCVVGVKPRQELKPFFQLSYEEHLKSSRCDPEGIRVR
jgi:hypothetical protein